MGSPARDIALRCLLKAEAAGQYTNLTIDTALARENLSEADKRLATALFYSVVEHRITLDAAIDGLSSLPPSSIEKAVRQTLRLAMAQLLYFDRIPDHAAIDEAVEMTPRRSKGFVNALLRQFCRGGKAIPLRPGADAPTDLSVRYSVHPRLAEAFLQIFGRERTEQLLSAFAVPPPVTVRVNTGRLDRDAFLARVGGSVPTRHAPYGVVLPQGAPLMELIREGECFVQDEASQIAVAALDVHPDMRVLDLCAAPGSKSFGAALDLKKTGEVKSFDLHENKLSLIRSGAERLGLANISVSAGDARHASPERFGRFDRVICDVPCSGYGVLWKKPDIRYKDPSAGAKLPGIQQDILEAGASCVAEGGVLLYSTCTLMPEENEQRVGAFLEKHPEFEPVPICVGGISETGGVLTLAPDTHGTDGFFMAKLVRKK